MPPGKYFQNALRFFLLGHQLSLTVAGHMENFDKASLNIGFELCHAMSGRYFKHFAAKSFIGLSGFCESALACAT